MAEWRHLLALGGLNQRSFAPLAVLDREEGRFNDAEAQWRAILDALAAESPEAKRKVSPVGIG